MSAVFTPRPYKLTVEDYHKLGEAGILTEDTRVELLEGELIEMAPIGGSHMAIVNRLTRLLVFAVGDSGVVSVQNPVQLPPHSEPQPDFAILRAPVAGAPATVPDPQDVLLLIEVADTTLAHDRNKKLVLYAKAGITESWIVNIPSSSLEVYREPSMDGYSKHMEVGRGASIAPLALPMVKIAVDDIFA